MDRLTPVQALASGAALLAMIAAAKWLDDCTMNPLLALKRRLFRPIETLEGYEQPELVDVIFRKTVAYKHRGDWPEMRGASTVLDFGGGCGIHYKQANSSAIRWAVVETPAMVERAAELSTGHLRFFASIPDAVEWLGPVDVIYSNGALQYTPDPIAALDQLCAIGARTMLWERLNLTGGVCTESTMQISNLIDNGPGRAVGVKNKSVRYRLTRIPEDAFLAAHNGYSLVERDDNSFRFVRAPSKSCSE